MRVRTVVLIAAAGALVLGGAGTGTTLALWTKSATVPSSSVTAGAISVTVNGSTSASIAGPTGLAGAGAAAGPAQSLSATLKNDSPSGAKNLRMAIYLDTVTASQTDLNSNLQVAAATVATGGTCPTPAGGSFKSIGAGYTSTLLTGTSTLPQASLKLCVDVRVKANPSGTFAGKSGTLTFTFRGQQVR